MFSACKMPLITAIAGLLMFTAAADDTMPAKDEICICADPNNLPFSNEKLEGFENELANLIGEELGREVTYYWWPQRRGFIRNTLRAHDCDIVMGIPSSFELAMPTRPYYRSSYVFVYRADRGFDIHSFDDEILRELEIGVHVVGDDYANVPPAQALVNRGITGHIHGYSVYGDYSKESPPHDLITAVIDGEVDVAIAWGPLAGYYAKKSPVPLEVVPVSPQVDVPFLPLVFDIAMGVRREDTALRDELNAILVRRQDDINKLLERYGVPLVQPHARHAQRGTTP